MLAAAAPSCTIAKPIVGALAGPFVILGESGGLDGCGCGDGRAFACAWAILMGVGAVGGLVTGIVSDVQFLTGAAAADPTANWWHPFRTNTSRTD